MQAAAIAQGIFQRNPKHPGAAHYIIHSFDDPDHAILSLTAAREYSKIAPSAAHALHMPSHIFVQLGMWDDVIASNVVAYKAAGRSRGRQEPAARPRGLPHAVVAAVRLPAGRQVRRGAEVRRSGQGGRRQGHGAERPRRLRGDESAPGGRERAVGEARAADRRGEGWRRARLRRQRGVRARGRPERRASSAISPTANVALEKLKAMRTQAESGSNAYRAKPFAIMEKEVGAAIAHSQKDTADGRAAAEGSDRDRADARRAVRSARADQAVVRAVRRPAARLQPAAQEAAAQYRAVAAADAEPPRSRCRGLSHRRQATRSSQAGAQMRAPG